MLTIHFFLREAVGQYEKKPLKQQSRSTKHKLQTHAIYKTGECGKKDEAKFPACDDHYHIEECQVFMSQIMENRSKKLYRKKLCCGCLGNISKEHNARSCSNRSICKVWSGTHPAVLHVLNIQKSKKKGNNEDNDVKEKKPEKVKCASTNTAPDVISMCIVPAQIKSQDTSKTVHPYSLLDSCSQGIFILDELATDLGISKKIPHLQWKQ